jgi:hypothetical protein
MAPQLCTAGSSALARPPAIGSSARTLATLFETTTRLIVDSNCRRDNIHLRLMFPVPGPQAWQKCLRHSHSAA